jgi:hypothetical protein
MVLISRAELEALRAENWRMRREVPRWILDRVRVGARSAGYSGSRQANARLSFVMQSGPHGPTARTLLLGPLQAAGPAARKPRPSMAIPERVGQTSGSLMGHSAPQRDIPDGIAGA